MTKAKQGLIRGMGTNRRTEGDYMAALLDTGAFAKAAFLSGRSRPGAVAQWVTL